MEIEIERSVAVSVIVICYGMLLRMGCIIEQDQGIIMDHSTSKYTPTAHSNILFKIHHPPSSSSHP